MFTHVLGTYVIDPIRKMDETGTADQKNIAPKQLKVVLIVGGKKPNKISETF